MSSKKPKTSVRARAKGTNKAKTRPASPSPAGDKARKAASAEIAERIARLEADGSATAGGDAAAPEAAKGGKAKRGGAAHGGTPAKAKPPKEPKPKKVSGLDAAALVLAEVKTPMKTADMLAEIRKRGLWSSKGKTPEATLYAAIIREIAAKGGAARFKKHDRGLFVTNR